MLLVGAGGLAISHLKKARPPAMEPAYVQCAPHKAGAIGDLAPDCNETDKPVILFASGR
jgi:hypothetical protein